MWLNKWKEGVLCLSLLAGFMLMSGTASAVPVSFTGTNNPFASGTFDATKTATQLFTVTSAADLIVRITTAQPGGGVSGFTLTNSADSDSLSAEVSGDKLGYVLNSSFVTGTTYTLNISGTTGRVYEVTMSYVPLPAAAWMFLSMMFGGAWLKRRGSKRSGAVAA